MHIAQDTFDFLRDLQENNNREWFLAQRERYDAALADVKSFITEMISELSAMDPLITTDIKASKCLFRIYRDIRFSKDKTPYKTWFSAGISLDGRKLQGPEYYFHLEPNKTILGVGYWRPGKEHLDLIRQEIDYSAADLHEALASGSFSAVDLSTEDKLKRPPTGYTEASENIELLKLKSFILYKSFTDKEMVAADALKSVLEGCQRMYPFKLFLQQAIS